MEEGEKIDAFKSKASVILDVGVEPGLKSGASLLGSVPESVSWVRISLGESLEKAVRFSIVKAHIGLLPYSVGRAGQRLELWQCHYWTGAQSHQNKAWF